MDEAGPLLEELVRGSGYRAVTLDRLVSQVCELTGASAACVIVRHQDQSDMGIVASMQGLDPDVIGRTLDGIDTGDQLVIPNGVHALVPPEDGGRGRLEVDLRFPGEAVRSLIGTQASLIGLALDQAKVPPRLAGSIISETAELASDLDDRGAYGLPKEAEMDVARTVAESLGLATAQVVEAEIATMLYPLGELARDDSRAPSLRRPLPLAPDRFVEAAAETVAHVPGLEPVATILRHHEERFDGSGVPARLAGDRIPVGSRIVAASKGLSALLFPSRGRPSLGPDEALAQLRAESGTRYDPAVVDALTAALAQIRASND